MFVCSETPRLNICIQQCSVVLQVRSFHISFQQFPVQSSRCLKPYDTRSTSVFHAQRPRGSHRTAHSCDVIDQRRCSRFSGYRTVPRLHSLHSAQAVTYNTHTHTHRGQVKTFTHTHTHTHAQRHPDAHLSVSTKLNCALCKNPLLLTRNIPGPSTLCNQPHLLLRQDS